MTARDLPMVGHGSKYRRKKEAAIEALLKQRNVEEAARAAGIGTQTLLRWLKMPEFQADYQEARRNAVSQTNGRLQGASGAAASTLFKVMVDGNAPASARVRAAYSVLDRANQAIDREDVQVRLAALEQAAKLAKLLKTRGPPGEEPIMSRSLIRRLERLETRLGVHRMRQCRLEFYDRSPNGTLIRRPHSDDDRTEGEHTIQVVFVSAAGNHRL